MYLLEPCARRRHCTWVLSGTAAEVGFAPVAATPEYDRVGVREWFDGGALTYEKRVADGLLPSLRSASQWTYFTDEEWQQCIEMHLAFLRPQVMSPPPLS